MAYSGINIWTSSRKSGGIQRVSTRFSLTVENEEADARRGGRTRRARPNSQALRGQGDAYFRCSADHEQDWQPYPVDPYSAIMFDGHTYVIYTAVVFSVHVYVYA